MGLAALAALVAAVVEEAAVSLGTELSSDHAVLNGLYVLDLRMASLSPR